MVPERDAIRVDLGGGFLLIAAGIRRERGADLTADLMLQNGKMLHVDRAVLNRADGPLDWSRQATADDRPSAEAMAEAIREQILPQALSMMQEDARKPRQSNDLVSLILPADELVSDAGNEVELFHDSSRTAFVTFTVQDRRQTWPVRSRFVRHWLAQRFYVEHGRAPSAQALVDAITVLEGRAIFEGPEFPVFTRIAMDDDRLYIDLANDRWQVVEVGPDGWHLTDTPPVKFRRTGGMAALPVPRKDGSLNDLRDLINVRSEQDWRLVVGWLLGAFRPRGPYAVLIVHGEQGSAKSTLVRALRALIDPNEAPIRSAPRDERDLTIAATNSWCLAFDNISHIPDWLSDAYCRLATGGGFATRTLYENDGETIFNSQRPISLNGIDEIATRGDLLDRAIVVYLPAIAETARRTEADLWRVFKAMRPGIFGGLLTAISEALRNEPHTVLPRKPRMADFARWVTAAEPALGWETGAFLDAYGWNRREANDLVLDASPLSQVLREWAVTLSKPWEGTASELLQLLGGVAGEQMTKLKTWPESGRTLSNRLRRLSPNLRAAGVVIVFDIRRHGGRRVIRVECTVERASPPSPEIRDGRMDAERGVTDGDDDGR